VTLEQLVLASYKVKEEREARELQAAQQIEVKDE
jgi:hypothetical protein